MKDLVSLGNRREVTNRMLAAEWLAKAHLVEARRAVEAARIDAAQKAEAQRRQADAATAARRVTA